MVKVVIDHEKCEGADCGECAEVCPLEVLVVEGDKVEIKCLEECSLCESCVDVCPNNALIIDDT